MPWHHLMKGRPINVIVNVVGRSLLVEFKILWSWFCIPRRSICCSRGGKSVVVVEENLQPSVICYSEDFRFHVSNKTPGLLTKNEARYWRKQNVLPKSIPYSWNRERELANPWILDQRHHNLGSALTLLKRRLKGVLCFWWAPHFFFFEFVRSLFTLGGWWRRIIRYRGNAFYE